MQAMMLEADLWYDQFQKHVNIRWKTLMVSTALEQGSPRKRHVYCGLNRFAKVSFGLDD